MTKSELRKARKIALQNGQKLTGELAIKKNLTASKRTINRANSRKRAAERKKTE
jgi:hypothetical protein